MGSDANRRQWATSQIEALYFLGKGGILALTNQCNPVLSVRPDGGNRLQRPAVRGLTLDALDPAVLWRYRMVLRLVVSDISRAVRDMRRIFSGGGF